MRRTRLSRPSRRLAASTRAIVIEGPASLTASSGRIVRPVCPSGNRYHGAVPEPPVIAYGRTLDADTWWAVLPSGAVVRRDGLNDLLLAVERIMAEEQPGRIFSFSLDSTGLWDPGDPEPTERGPEPTSAKG